MTSTQAIPSLIRGKSWQLGFLAFSAGVVVMSLELVASRILTPVFGSSTYTWGSLIGVILTGLSIGYYLGGKVADKNPTFQKFCLVIFSTGLYIVFIPFISPSVLGFSVEVLPASQFAVLLATFTLLIIPTILLGFVSPYAVKLATNTLSKLGKISGNLYSIATAGSIFGTFFTVFALIPVFEVRQIIFGLGLTLMLTSLLGLGKIPKVVIFFVIIILFTPSSSVVIGLVSHSGTLVYEKETPYSHLDVTDSSNLRTLYLDGNRHSQMNIEKPDKLTLTYTKYFHLGKLFNPSAENVLFIGGGGFSGPKNFLTTYPDIKVDVVEIDPDVIDAAKNYFYLQDNPRMRIFNDDARIFLSKTDEKYDVIILDAYTKNYVPFHLITLEYFQLLDESLQPNGVIVSNLLGSLVGDTSNLVRSVYKTMNDVFPTLYLFPTRENSAGISQNIILVATKADTEYSKDDLSQMAIESGLVDVLEGVEYQRNYYDVEVNTEDVPLLTDQFSPVESLLNPLTSKPYEIDGLQTRDNLSGIQWSESTLVTIGFLVVTSIFWLIYLRIRWREKIRKESKF
ncbi:MAG: polyamine aminopropyltransferase [Marine Group I thaumarchaeote]|nr:MAG: polyamine aminopropyltransferase [Marine Group I thaumarchaeote]